MERGHLIQINSIGNINFNAEITNNKEGYIGYIGKETHKFVKSPTKQNLDKFQKETNNDKLPDGKVDKNNSATPPKNESTESEDLEPMLRLNICGSREESEDPLGRLVVFRLGSDK